MLGSKTLWMFALLPTLGSSCVLAPAGLKAERAKLDAQDGDYASEFAARVWPALPESPALEDFLQRAFLSNGEIEAAWHAWRAAVAKVTRMSTWPNTNVELGLEHVFSSENVKAWDRTTLSAGFDAADTLELPSKTAQRGDVALAEARAAGERFRSAKFGLQRRFLETWIALAKLEAETKLRTESLALLSSLASAAERSAALGANQAELVRARLELASEEDAIARLKSMCSQMCVQLHAMVGAPADVEIHAPEEFPAPRALDVSDADLFALAATTNPKLAEFAMEVRGRTDALALARAAWLPDIVPSAGFTGSVAQFVGVSLSLPTGVPAVRAAIEEARADLDRSRALARQSQVDVRASITAELLALRDAERAREFLDASILPLTQQLEASSRNAYAGGTATQREWLEVARTALLARMALLDARAARETSLARIEEWIGVDLETLAVKAQVKHGS